MDLLLDFSLEIDTLKNNIDNYLDNLSKEIDNKDIVYISSNFVNIFEKSVANEKYDYNKLIDIRYYFYRKVFDICTLTNDLNIISDIGSRLINNINIIVNNYFNQNNNPYYLCVMDILVLTAISYYLNRDVYGSRKYFDMSINHGEKYLNNAKEHFYDELCCAHSWMGLICFNEGNYKEALDNYNRVVQLHDEVVDDSNFYEKEYSYE